VTGERALRAVAEATGDSVNTIRANRARPWGGARRLTIREAVEEVLSRSTESLPFEAIAREAATLVGRPLNSAAVSASLVALDAAYDTTRATWSRVAAATDDEVVTAA